MKKKMKKKYLPEHEKDSSMQLIVPGHILHFFESVHEVASPSNEEQEQSGLKDSGSPSIGETSGIELEKQFIDSKTMGMEE